MNALSTALLAACLIAGAAAAQQTPPAAIDAERKKQDQIYQGRGEQRPDGYVIDRSLLAYGFILQAEFKHTLAALGPQDRWLDIGAGRGRAVRDYYTERYDSMNPEGREHRGNKAATVAISIEDRRTPRWHEAAARLPPGKIEYLAGKRLSEYTPQELGRFQLVTDVIGGFSYTERLSVFLENVLRILAVNGAFYTLLQDVQGEDGSNKPHYAGSPYLTEIKDAAGKPVRVCTWLKRIRCAEVTCDLKADFNPPVESYRVKKTCDDVVVPALRITHFEAGTPPERGFGMVETPQGKTQAPRQAQP